MTQDELYHFYIHAGSQMAKMAVLVSDPSAKNVPRVRRFMTAKLFGKNVARKIKIGRLKK